VTGQRLVFRPAAARAVIANHHFEVVRLPVVLQVLQKMALVPGALLGRALGYRPTNEGATGVAALA